jgi:hypothetical protein
MKTTWFQGSILFALVVLLGLVWWKHQSLQDWWKLRGYTPPSAISVLASEDTMNAYTTHLFYLNKPQLLSTVDSFRQHCPENENTIVLGCYHPDQNGIYIYAVQDPSLAGIQQVTAAHEVLHAVYARLSSSARTQLDNELESYYKNGLTSPTVKAEVALYQKTEPNSVYDEMSCTFGTEIAQLPAALNAYYAQFFTNRQKIVGYEQQYQGQFTQRENQISADDAQLASMKQQIDSQETSLTAENNSLNTQKSQLEQMLSSGKVGTYNSAVAGYDSQVDSYNTALASLKQEIMDYNNLVSTRNSVAGQLTTLDTAIDTRLPAAPGQ